MTPSTLRALAEETAKRIESEINVYGETRDEIVPDNLVPIIESALKEAKWGRHYHKAGEGFRDKCGICGDDLRSLIHLQAGEKP